VVVRRGQCEECLIREQAQRKRVAKDRVEWRESRLKVKVKVNVKVGVGKKVARMEGEGVSNVFQNSRSL
jgi:hypothetical protein